MKKRIRLALERKEKNRQRTKLNELEELKQKGIQFPDYNPPPERKKDLSGKLRHLANIIDQKTKARNRTKESRKTSFVGWEYKDRFSYKKK